MVQEKLDPHKKTEIRDIYHSAQSYIQVDEDLNLKPKH